jgi:gamma-glutamyltranspeptidase
MDEADLLVTSRNGAVSSDVAVCSKHGVEILKIGGSAVDAAISTSLCLGTYNPFASGLGGGGFMVITLPNGTSLTINFRETASKAAKRDMFNDRPLSAQSHGLAVAVPGEISGFEMAHQLLGRLEWGELFKDMIDLNQKDFLVSPRLERKIRFRETGILNEKEKKGKRQGEIIQRPALAKTLSVIATEGSAAFYKGRIAQSLVRLVQENDGILTLEDMDSYKAVLEDTIKTEWLGRDVITCGPPCR